MLDIRTHFAQTSVLFFFFSLFVVQGYSQTWSRSQAPYGRNLNDAAILSQDKLVVVGGNLSNDAIWSIFTSSSSGLSWDINQDVISAWARSCSFYNNEVGVVVGDLGKIERTVDAGQNWADVTSPTNQVLNDVFFVDSANGFAVGGIYDIQDTFQVALKSTDGGQSWSFLFDQEGRPLQSVFFTDANDGVAVGDSGIIMKTDDGGQNWEIITPPVYREFNTVEFLNPSTGFIVGGRFTNDSIRTILKTTDGGDNWNVILDEPGGWLRDIAFVNQDTGYLVGDVSTVLKTSDGGNTWNPVALPQTTGTERFNAIKFLSEDFGIIAGNAGVVYALHNVPLPEVETLPAIVQPSETEILFQGHINTFGHAAQYSFMFTDNPGSTYIEFIPSNITANQTQLIEFLGPFFTPATTYHYCLKATSIAGSSYGDTLSITTTIPFDTLRMDSVLNQQIGMPEFYGTVSGFSENASLFFEYAQTGATGIDVIAQPATITDGNTYVPSYSFSSQLSSGIYSVRLKAVTSSETYYSSSIQFFCGLPYDQLEMISAEYDLLTETVSLEGYVDNIIGVSSFNFLYWVDGLGGAGGSQPSNPANVDDTLPHTLSATLTGLTPNTEYNVSLQMFGPYGPFNSQAISFYTGVAYQNFETKTATQITPTTAILNGYANGLSYNADIVFEYGETTQFGQTVVANPANISDILEHEISAQLQNLNPNTLYYYRLKGDVSGTAFHANTRQFFTGPPEIPNWDFQNWEHKTVELPLGWSVMEDEFERVDLGGGNSALKLFGSNAALMGYFITESSTEEGMPQFISLTPFNYQPDSVFVNINYFTDTGDTTMVMVKLDSADVTVSMGMYPIAGNSGGSFVELGFPIEYFEVGTPDRVTLVVLTENPEEGNLPSPSTFLSVDRIHFGSMAPSITAAEFNNWESYSYANLDEWSYFKFLNGVSGDFSDPPAATLNVYGLFGDTAVLLRNKLFEGKVMEANIQVGDSPFEETTFPIDRKHEVLTGYMQFNRQGTDSLHIHLEVSENGQYVGTASFYFTESTTEMVPFEVPVMYNTYPNQPQVNPDAAELRISLENSDDISLSEVMIDKLCFDGFYVGHIDSVPDGILSSTERKEFILFPNPTTGLVNLHGMTVGTNLRIYDMKGAAVFTTTITETNTQLDLADITPGIYLVHTTLQQHGETKRLIIIPPSKTK